MFKLIFDRVMIENKQLQIFLNIFEIAKTSFSLNESENQ